MSDIKFRPTTFLTGPTAPTPAQSQSGSGKQFAQVLEEADEVAFDLKTIPAANFPFNEKVEVAGQNRLAVQNRHQGLLGLQPLPCGIQAMGGDGEINLANLIPQKQQAARRRDRRSAAHLLGGPRLVVLPED